MTNLDNILKSREITLSTKVVNKGLAKAMVFSNSHIWMWVLDYKESWAPKNWCFWTVVLKKTLKSPLDSKEIQPVHPKGNQSWIFIGRTDVEAETPVLWPPDAKSWLTGKEPGAGKDWWREEKGTTEDEDGWMPSPTQWTWVWVNSESWWWTGSPGVLQSMGSQIVRHNWATELKWRKVRQGFLLSASVFYARAWVWRLRPLGHPDRFSLLCWGVYSLGLSCGFGGFWILSVCPLS